MVDKINNLPESSLDLGSQELTEEHIRLRAYELFEARGCEHGHDIEDWITAENEILGKTQIKSVSRSTPTIADKTAAA